MVDQDAARRRLLDDRNRLRETLAASRSLGSGAAVAERSELSAIDQHPADSATELTSRETAQALESTMRSELDRVEAALARLEAGSYGRCEVCERDIEPERLEVAPVARTCIEHRDQDRSLPGG